MVFQITFAILRKPAFPWKKAFSMFLFPSMLRTTSWGKRLSHGSSELMEIPIPFPNWFHLSRKVSRISTILRIIIGIEPIFSPLPAVSRAGRSYHDRSNPFLPSIPVNLSPSSGGVHLESPVPYLRAIDLMKNLPAILNPAGEP